MTEKVAYRSMIAISSLMTRQCTLTHLREPDGIASIMGELQAWLSPLLSIDIPSLDGGELVVYSSTSPLILPGLEEKKEINTKNYK